MIEHNLSKKRTGRKLSKTRALRKLLKEIDADVVDSFTPEQLRAINKAMQVKEWRTHSIDFRPTLMLPFIPWNFYMVFLLGVNKRHLSSSERFMAGFMFLLVLFLVGLTVFGFILLILYLMKSALGIDIFPNDSLGVWDEFKRLFSD